MQVTATRDMNQMVRLAQKPGDKIYVPPGWIHTVYTNLPCVKVAWDCYDPAHVHYYAYVHRHINSGLFSVQEGPANNAEDFMISESMLRWFVDSTAAIANHP